MTTEHVGTTEQSHTPRVQEPVVLPFRKVLTATRPAAQPQRSGENTHTHTHTHTHLTWARVVFPDPKYMDGPAVWLAV